MNVAFRQFALLRNANAAILQYATRGVSRHYFHSTSAVQSQVSMESIKELRKRTGAPIGTVKKALLEKSGDLEAAIDHLRKLGANMAAKKAHREASEGLVGIAISEDKKTAAMVELNSETDFVARTSQFQQVLSNITISTLNSPHSTQMNGLTVFDTKELLNMNGNMDLLSTAVSSLGENIVLRRACRVVIAEGSGAIFGYAHGTANESNGKIGALTALKGSDLEDTGKRVAMHVAAGAPDYISVQSIPDDDLEKERTILIEAIEAERNPGDKPKSPAILQKITDGRIKKWYSTVVLEEQEMLVETPAFSGKPRSVAQHLAAECHGAKVLAIARFAVGEK